MKHKEIAARLFVEGYNCAQSVFAAFADTLGLDREFALKLSAPFGGGMGRMREVCGACSGMFMVVGALRGYTDPTDNKAKAEHYKLIQELAERFKEQMGGTIICRELLAGLKSAAPISSDPLHPTPRDAAFYKARPCLRFVECAADTVDDWLESEGIE